MDQERILDRLARALLTAAEDDGSLTQDRPPMPALLERRRPRSAGAGPAPGLVWFYARAGSWAIRGSQPSDLGRYQFRSPRSFIVAGSSTARTMVASIR